MRFLLYKDLDLRRVKPTFAKVRAAIEANDFKSPDVKKLHVGNYYRARAPRPTVRRPNHKPEPPQHRLYATNRPGASHARLRPPGCRVS